jgi:acyl transferase domain-containing protein
MQRETIPAMPHVRTPNSKIDWSSVPLDLPRENRPWRPQDDGWFCSVNSFGIGGLNTHVVLTRPLAPTGRIAMPAKTSSGTLTSDGSRMATNDSANKLVEPASSNRSLVSTKSGTFNPIAVIGVGAILPGAIGTAAFFETLRDQRVTLSRIPAERWSELAYPENVATPWAVRSRLGGVVNGYHFDWKRHRIPPKQVAHASPLQFMILDSVEQATEMAGLDFTSDLRLRCGVVVGTTFGGEFSNQLQVGLRLPEFRRRLTRLLAAEGVNDHQCEKLTDEFSDRLLAAMPALLDETGSFTSSSLASRVTKNLDLMGGAVAVDSGNTSFGSALTCCVDQLSCGDNDLMICVGAQQDLGPSRYVGMTRSGMLGNSSGNDGVFPGEGAVAVVLQRLSDAERTGRKILAVIQGVGSGFDSACLPRSLDGAMETALASHAKHAGDQQPDKQTDRFIEQVWAGPSRFDGEVETALAWRFRSPEGANTHLQTHDSSRLVGHLGGGSMAVSMLAAIGRCMDQHGRPAVNPTASANKNREHWVVGGGQGECTQAILLRSY